MKIITVVAAVIERGPHVLCVRRGHSNHQYLSGKWEFPGGKIEAGETETTALSREILEELSMTITITEKLMVVEHTYPDFQLTMHTYRCQSGDTPTLHEHEALHWLTREELPALDWAAADWPIVNYLIKQK
ncbi:MAG: (deoxy)nucleoside triphosphate pyrophosphohydrolase [Bacteroidota bacterium]